MLAEIRDILEVEWLLRLSADRHDVRNIWSSYSHCISGHSLGHLTIWRYRNKSLKTRHTDHLTALRFEWCSSSYGCFWEVGIEVFLSCSLSIQTSVKAKSHFNRPKAGSRYNLPEIVFKQYLSKWRGKNIYEGRYYWIGSHLLHHYLSSFSFILSCRSSSGKELPVLSYPVLPIPYRNSFPSESWECYRYWGLGQPMSKTINTHHTAGYLYTKVSHWYSSVLNF